MLSTHPMREMQIIQNRYQMRACCQKASRGRWLPRCEDPSMQCFSPRMFGDSKRQPLKKQQLEFRAGDLWCQGLGLRILNRPLNTKTLTALIWGALFSFMVRPKSRALRPWPGTTWQPWREGAMKQAESSLCYSLGYLIMTIVPQNPILTVIIKP